MDAGSRLRQTKVILFRLKIFFMPKNYLKRYAIFHADILIKHNLLVILPDVGISAV